MKKKLLSLLALMMVCISGAWAQTVVTTPSVSTSETQYRYTLHCKATDHNSYLGIKDDAFNGRLAEEYATLFEFEAGPADGQYYLRSVELGYVTADGGNITFEATPSTYWTINPGEGWVYLLANGQNGVYLNNNKPTGDGIKTAAGTGDCSHWVLTEYQTNAEPLSWAEVKDGYTYAIVNVQPESVNKTYYLNSVDGVLNAIDATGFNSLSNWATTAQFVAVKQADGKFAFKNVATNQYLAWRGANGGANDNKGFVDEVNNYSTWTMHESARYTGTYWFVAKRANGNDGSLILSNAGEWNAWGNSEVTGRDDFSNQFGFVELAAPTMPLMEFNYVLQFETYTLNVPVRGRVGDAMPTVTIPNLFTATQPTGVIAADQEDVTITLTLKDGIMPFQYFEQSSAITQWYTLRMRDSYWMKYSATGDTRFPLSATEPAANDNTRLFGFVGNPLHGFKIVSYAEGEYKYVTATTGNNSTCGAADDEADATTLLFEVNDGHKVFHLEGNAYLNAIASSTKLGVWNHSAAATDGGSTFTFAEADVAAFDLSELKAEVIASLPTNIPALYSAEDIATATDAINAVTCGADEESINAAKAAIKAAKNTLLKTAEGKKVAIKSLSSFSTRDADYYLTAEAAGTQMTSNTELTKNAVYELTFNEEQAAYTIQAIANETYLPKTAGGSSAVATTEDVANAGFYTLTSTENEDHRVILTNINGAGVSDSQGGIHLDAYKKIVVWGPTGEASKWVIETVSDEQWAEMNPTYDWAVFETLLNQLKSMTFGDKLGQYTVEGQNSEQLNAAIELYYQGDFDAKDEDQYADDMDMMQYLLDNAVLNLPKAGSFLRIKGAATGTYISAKGVAPARAELTENADEAVLYLNENGQLVGTICGYGFYGTHSYTAGASIETQTFAEAPYARGAYLIKSNYDGSQVLVDWTDGRLNRWGTENDVRSTWYVEEVDFVPVAVGAAGYATLYAPVALEIPAGVNVYTLAEEGDDVLTANPLNGVIPANTGVIVEAQDGTHKFNITETAETATSCLSGTATPAVVENVYTLGYGNEGLGLGFYKFAGETVKGFHAYFEKAAEARAFGVIFGGETAIQNVELNANNAVIYNMAGQRVNKAEKGIYIINGKKVLK